MLTLRYYTTLIIIIIIQLLLPTTITMATEYIFFPIIITMATISREAQSQIQIQTKKRLHGNETIFPTRWRRRRRRVVDRLRCLSGGCEQRWSKQPHPPTHTTTNHHPPDPIYYSVDLVTMATHTHITTSARSMATESGSQADAIIMLAWRRGRRRRSVVLSRPFFVIQQYGVSLSPWQQPSHDL